jgi:hypothetical protein
VPASAADILAAYPRAGERGARLTAQIAGRLGIDPAWLANAIQAESGWNAAARNKYSGASGLIQFMPDTARRLGTDTASIRALSVEQQLPLVERFLWPYRGKMRDQTDVFLAIFYPRFLGRPHSARFPQVVVDANPHAVTVGSLYAQHMRNAKLPDVAGDYVPGEAAPAPLVQLPEAPAARPRPRPPARPGWSRRAKIVLGSGAAFFGALSVLILIVRART